MLVAVGRHPEELAPSTTVSFIGEFDATVERWADDVRVGVLTGSSRS